ncbi:2OG-Fe(II) oxygenase [Polynucleobacter alcilacus]|uniref:2OG-Fe(II) oxygenase n=1 Tax=Polynucleobacter alcilacus TaxID=1819739 RepID=UPI001C0E1934|nr:2OG-Fe(II) oxygenase [Polynucleobacter alcilacus]MBU3566575.1 2OG-Fe(II) oxygenase [Polynucleobacter alcilacus]
MVLEDFINKNIIDSVDDLRSRFLNAKPFKHLQIDNFFDPELVSKLIKDFPAPKKEEMLNEFGGVSLKHTVKDVRNISPTYQSLDDMVSSSDFIKFMENITGIHELIYDPSYFGGGTHNNLSGQAMDPHVDFNYLDIPNIGKVHRRINAIVYLNKTWDESWGGNLDLHSDPWDPRKDQLITVVPKKNRLILFETNEYSWHGFHAVNHLVPFGMSRKSFAIYMYTKDRPQDEIKPSHGTFYVPRIPIEMLKPGVVLTNEMISALEAARINTLGLIKESYNTQLNLSQSIADREYETKELKNELSLLKLTN